MTDHLALFVPGRPRGQGRPRTGRNPRTGAPVVFTDAASRTYAQLVQGEWIAAGRPKLPEGPYALNIEAVYARPAGHHNQAGALNSVGRRSPYPGKPDLDNAVKGLLDALVAVGAIPDDRLLVELGAIKRWGHPGEGDGVVVNAYAQAVEH